MSHLCLSFWSWAERLPHIWGDNWGPSFLFQCIWIIVQCLTPSCYTTFSLATRSCHSSFFSLTLLLTLGIFMTEGIKITVIILIIKNNNNNKKTSIQRFSAVTIQSNISLHWAWDLASIFLVLTFLTFGIYTTEGTEMLEVVLIVFWPLWLAGIFVALQLVQSRRCDAVCEGQRHSVAAGVCHCSAQHGPTQQLYTART